MSKSSTLSAALQATILEGHEWGVCYGAVGDTHGSQYPAKFVTTDIAGPAGFALAAAAAEAMDRSKPVLAIHYKGPKRLAIATLAPPSTARNGATEQLDVPLLPHSRNLSLTP